MTDKQLPKRSIKKLRLENFQCYEDATLNLDSGINLITGSSDHGKTALIRALKFLMHNIWDESFRRYGTSETRVTVWFSDGAVCSRIKGDKRNCMMVRYANGKVETFDKWKGTKYPPEVVKVLGNPPEDEAHGEISFAEQFEPLYMVMLTNTALPKSISELINIDDLDEAATMLSRKSKQEARKVKDLLERIGRYDSELDNYEGLDEELEKLAELEEIEARIDAKIAEISDAKDIMRRFKDVMSEGIDTSNALKKAKSIAAYKDKYLAITVKKAAIDDAISMAEEYDNICFEMEETEYVLSRMTHVASITNKDRLGRIKTLISSVEDVQETVTEYQTCCDELTRVSSEIDQFQESLKKNRKQAEAMRKKLTDEGLLCPTCNQPIGEDACLKN